jgi:flagellar motor protein MotB
VAGAEREEALVIALAAALATEGRRDEAEELLRDLPGPGGPERNDLLARLRAQAGDLDAAEALWKKVPADSELAVAAQAGLHRIEVLRRRPSWLRFNLAAALGLVAVCAVAAVVVAGVVVAMSSSDGGVSQSSPASSGSPTQGPVAAQTPSTGEGDAPSPSPTTGSGETQPPQVDFQVPGVELVSRGDAVVASFAHGLFQQGSVELTQAGLRSLTAIGAGLRASGVALALRVVGHTDDQPVHAGGSYSSNAALGFARAAAAATVLQRASGLPLSAVSAASAGPSAPLGDNATAAGRERNRSVVIEVRQR